MMKFAIRTVRGGRVKINGSWYGPNDAFVPYDGRLDGQRFAFSLYPNTDAQVRPLVSLWGTEEQYRFVSGAPREGWEADFAKLPEPHCVDGSYVWTVWRKESE